MVGCHPGGLQDGIGQLLSEAVAMSAGSSGAEGGSKRQRQGSGGDDSQA